MWFEIFQRIFFFRANQLTYLAISNDGTPVSVALEGIHLPPVILPFEPEEESVDHDDEEEDEDDEGDEGEGAR